MSPLSVMRAPHYVKKAELGHSYFLGQRHGRREYLPLDTNVRKHALWLLFSFLSSKFSTTTVAKVSQ